MRIDNEQFDQFMARLQSQPPTLRDTQATADAIMLRIARKPKRKLLVPILPMQIKAWHLTD
ncbi:MAG: hypothetical protein PHC48_01140 [Prevotella sp.]|nr:hypothetical protein [Prevotella sp.]